MNPIKHHIWNIALYGSVAWTLRQTDRNYLGSSEMCCWRKIEKITWIDRVRNEEVLQRVKEERNILQTMKRRNAD
jgi:hypothetical protein